MIRALVICSLVTIVLCFPDGAPTDTCTRVERTNQPNHGKARSQPLNTMPYRIIASTDQYNPGSFVNVKIVGQDVFRGFFIQARDGRTNEKIGNFVNSTNINLLPECSGITHNDNKDKSEASLNWQAPQHIQGQVIFTGTIVKDYGTFWSDFIAQVPVQQYQQQY